MSIRVYQLADGSRLFTPESVCTVTVRLQPAHHQGGSTPHDVAKALIREALGVLHVEASIEIPLPNGASALSPGAAEAASACRLLRLVEEVCR